MALLGWGVSVGDERRVVVGIVVVFGTTIPVNELRCVDTCSLYINYKYYFKWGIRDWVLYLDINTL